MNGLETIAQGMQLLFQGMFFVLGAVIYSVVVCSLVDAENREKWLVPIPLAFGMGVLLVLPYLLGWVGWVFYFALIVGWAAVILWLNPPLRETIWQALICLWERAEPVVMPHRVAARKAHEKAERQAKAAEKLRRQQEAEAREREAEARRERERERERKRQAEREASGEAERERQAEAARWARLMAEAEAEAQRQAAAAETERKAEAKRTAALEAERRAEAKGREAAADDEDDIPMF